ncbi:lytic transglycosylase domain-containing protein [Altererythrobacter aquiaggeris]|uniref:lytic transglycosylase domain-containing protein n=1 Tax=Aestuarierythrobacter aquiaggeris TaxID=1898396 RepID=UPI003017097D
MQFRHLALVTAASLAAALPATAARADTAEYFRARIAQSAAPTLLSPADREFYREIFRLIDREQWVDVESRLNSRSGGPLHDVARAEYYLHANSPQIALPAIEALLETGRYLPQAEQLSNLALKRGATSLPSLPQASSLVPQPYASKRVNPRSINDGTLPEEIRAGILDRIKNDDPDGARQLLDGIDSGLSSSARAEWRRRVAWSYYIENDDRAALGMAQTVREGSGPWVAEGDWVVGLAAWRLGDCDLAASGFERAALGSTDPELTAAARYWASRSYIRCRFPERAAEQLRAAAVYDETLYGMLAREQLGQQLAQTHSEADFSNDDWKRLDDEQNVRVAIQLAEIGRSALADEVLRHQARIGNPRDYDALSRLARDLGLPSTQLWMAHNAPRGARSQPVLRYPAPKWTPVSGWEVDPALAYAHALQESNFRAAVVSPAGAKGLMQIMPIAAREHASSLNMDARYANLADPEVNLAFGQRALQQLNTSRATQGKLPKIMAAYNAGLTPVTRWESEIRDQDDPLLYIESIPYWETRGYVGIVMRNYWMYERQAGSASPSRQAMAQGEWPKFPETPRGGR